MSGPLEEERFRALWHSARAGDEAARAELLESLRERLFAFLARRMGAEAKRRSEVEDLVQNALLDLHRRMAGFPHDLSAAEFLSYGLQIARWRLGDLMKPSQDFRGASELPKEPPASPHETGVVTRADERRFCREQIESLAEPDRVVLEAFHLRGLTIAEIAAQLAVETNVVKQRLVRARRRLRDLIVKGRSVT